MTVPIWSLLGFAAWTLLLLLLTIGVYRWFRVLTGRAGISEFRADQVEGQDWYKRAMRAHANCIENLPVFVVIVFALYAANVAGTLAVLKKVGNGCAPLSNALLAFNWVCANMFVPFVPR